MDGELHRDHIRSELGGFFDQGHTHGSVTTGTFAYDEDTLRSLVHDWLALADSYDASLYDARGMAVMEGPGTDFASKAQAKAASDSALAYLDYLRNKVEYCTTQAQQFQNALDDYLGIEHRNVTEINKTNAPRERAPRAGI